ncbi:hypothetical protein CQW23_27487 [Capsicum baccatum]|uniref:Uncharacterized protein n=1 Tax=Capsicum baccatum TaxID=33114 RepID=A0A2G2VDU2_CAPBA|nr:hypothetical protein CQW23_27487 [Capsicum baccatum]
MNILSRLPVRTLHQCKCVSKFWNTLISDPYFKMKHFKRAKNDRNSQKFLITLLCENESRFSSYCCPLSSSQMAEDAQKLVRPLSSKPLFRVVCACDGLVVVTVSDIMTDRHPMHLLWNPSIRESIVLPASEFEAGEFTRYGFGYDSTSGDHKILRICDESNEILALKVGSWRKINKHPHGVYNAMTRTHSLAFVREAFHWIGSSRECGSREYSLVSFSMSKEMYGEIPLPEEILSLVGIVFVGVSVLDGMLCVHAMNRLRGFKTHKLWALKDHGVKESWSGLFTMEDPSIYRFIPKYRFADGELLFSCVNLPSDEPVFRTSSGPFVSWPDAGYIGGVVYTESLISPRSLIY